MAKKRFWIVALALVLIIGGGGYLYYHNVYSQSAEPVAEPTVRTAPVRRGDLMITADGSGTLVPTTELALGFRSGGVLDRVLVDVDDRVQAGDVLARLDDADAQAQVEQAEIALRQAELKLAELTQGADPVELAAAQAALAAAQADLARLTSPPGEQEVLAARENLKSAQERLDTLLAGPDPEAVEIAKSNLTLAEIKLRAAQAAYDRVAPVTERRDGTIVGIGETQEAAELWQATTEYERAKAEYEEVRAGPTADEIADARAQVALAQAQLDALLADPDPAEVAAAEAKVAQAQAQLDALLAGASADDLEAAQLNVSQAQLALETAQRQLAYTELIAPLAGTVLSVEAQEGEAVGSNPIITLADLQNPQVLFWVEESDLAGVVPGNAVNIVFEALPDYTFPGKIVSVDPALVTVEGTPAVQAYASVDLSDYPGSNLLVGMNADLEIVAGEAHNALLVPIQALRELGPNRYAVFVVKENGELELRPVTVGLKDFVNAEIRSGLQEGEIVSLGEETDADTAPSPVEEEAPPGILQRFLGGG